MKCPVCPDNTLVMTHRQGVEIDYCPDCRGVWLDRGELDKIIERSAAELGQAPSAAAERPAAAEWARPGTQTAAPAKRKKRSSLLDELFDF